MKTWIQIAVLLGVWTSAAGTWADEIPFRANSEVSVGVVEGTIHDQAATHISQGDLNLYMVNVGNALSYDEAVGKCADFKGGPDQWELINTLSFFSATIAGGGQVIDSAIASGSNERVAFAFWAEGMNREEKEFLVHSTKFLMMQGMNTDIQDLKEVTAQIKEAVANQGLSDEDKAHAEEALAKLEKGLPVVCVSKNLTMER